MTIREKQPCETNEPHTSQRCVVAAHPRRRRARNLSWSDLTLSSHGSAALSRNLCLRGCRPGETSAPDGSGSRSGCNSPPQSSDIVNEQKKTVKAVKYSFHCRSGFFLVLLLQMQYRIFISSTNQWNYSQHWSSGFLLDVFF